MYNYKELLNYFVEKYPKLFSKKDIKPLKCGILQELTEKHPEIKKRNIKKFLHRYCWQLEYVLCQQEGAERYNLLGENEGYVTQDHYNQVQNKKNQILKNKELSKKKKEHDNKICIQQE